MATKTDSLSWRNIDPATLPTGLSALYEDYKTAQRIAAQARDAFESAFTEIAAVPTSQTMLFGYRFGKLSIAISDEPRKAKSTAPAALDFASLLKR